MGGEAWEEREELSKLHSAANFSNALRRVNSLALLRVQTKERSRRRTWRRLLKDFRRFRQVLEGGVEEEVEGAEVEVEGRDDFFNSRRGANQRRRRAWIPLLRRKEREEGEYMFATFVAS